MTNASMINRAGIRARRRLCKTARRNVRLAKVLARRAARRGDRQDFGRGVYDAPARQGLNERDVF